MGDLQRVSMYRPLFYVGDISRRIGRDKELSLFSIKALLVLSVIKKPANTLVMFIKDTYAIVLFHKQCLQETMLFCIAGRSKDTSHKSCFEYCVGQNFCALISIMGS